MERTLSKPKVTEDGQEPLFRWKNNGNSFHWFDKHKIIKPGEIFLATESDIPKAFRDILAKVDDMPIQEQVKVIPGKVATYELVEVEVDEKTMYNVVNNKGKLLNEKPLTKAKAEKLFKDLTE